MKLSDNNSYNEYKSIDIDRIKLYVKHFHGAEYNHFVDMLYIQYNQGKFHTPGEAFVYLTTLNDELYTKHSFLIDPIEIDNALGLPKNEYDELQHKLFPNLGMVSGLYVHNKHLLEKHGVKSLQHCHPVVSDNLFEFLVYNECFIRNLHSSEGRNFVKPGQKKVPNNLGNNKGGGIIGTIRKIGKQVTDALQK